MIKVRAVFEKCGRAKYISHLDLNRCMQRCFKRSGIPIWYTEGFNPHIYITFALPLSLGYESRVEIMDFNITEDEDLEAVMDKLNAAMPEGIKVLKVYFPKTKHTLIKYADFKIIFLGNVMDEMSDFIENGNMTTVKKTKRGEKEIDLREYVKLVECDNDSGNTAVTLRLPAGNDLNINPSLVTDLFIGQCGKETEILSVERTAILDGEEKVFE